MAKLNRFQKLCEEPVLLALLLVTLVFALLNPKNLSLRYVDWDTIVSLAGLIVVTTGIKESGLLQKLSRGLVKRARTERSIAILLVAVSAALSTLLTNDVTLLIVVPLTISIGEIVKSRVEKLVIFETLAVNVGSALTPVGNPQNLFLWHRWGVSFLQFCVEMFPAVFVCFVLLVFFVFASFSRRELDFEEGAGRDVNGTLALVSVVLACIYIAALELKLELIAFIFVLVVFLLVNREVLKKADWLLLLIFVLMFVDVGYVAKLECVRRFVESLNLNRSNVFLVSALLSQVMSNVPAAMFMSHFSSSWKAICYGVNVGGNGFIVASLANIISVRYVGSRMLVDFHRYSIVYFLLSLAVVYFLFF